MTQTPHPAAAGFDPERLKRIDRHLRERYVEAGRFAGVSLAIHRRGALAHRSVIGQADAERGKPMAEDTLLRIYSMTKPVTSIALMQLVEQGLIALDDPVHKWIPAWQNLAVHAGGATPNWRTRPVARPMQVVDLLRHTSGLTYGFQESTNVDAAYRKVGIGAMEKRTITLAQMIEALAGIPLEFSPGTAWNYSVSTDVVAYLVEKVSGLAFGDYLKRHVTGPLGMADTDFHVPEAQAGRLAACYVATAGGGRALHDDPATSPFLKPPVFVSGGGGLVSTLPDYLRFARMLLGRGTLDGVQVVSPKTIELMTANHLPGGVDLPALSRSMFSEATYNGIGFGLGFSVTLDPARTLIPGSAGEFAWGGMASTAFWVDPKEDLAVVFMTQLMPSSTWPVRRELRTLVYSAFTS